MLFPKPFVINANTGGYAIKKVGPAKAAIFMNLNTLFAVTRATVFLNEVIRINHVVGFILILSGIFIGTGALWGEGRMEEWEFV